MHPTYTVPLVPHAPAVISAGGQFPRVQAIAKAWEGLVFRGLLAATSPELGIFSDGYSVTLSLVVLIPNAARTTQPLRVVFPLELPLDAMTPDRMLAALIREWWRHELDEGAKLNGEWLFEDPHPELDRLEAPHESFFSFLR